MGSPRAHLSGCRLACVSVTECRWVTARLRESERRRRVCVCVSLSACHPGGSLSGCVRVCEERFFLRTPRLARRFSTADSSQPTPEVGASRWFHPQEI